MQIFTSLETSKKLAKYLKPKEGHKFYCSEYWDGEFQLKNGKPCDTDIPAYTFEQILEEIGEKVYSVGFVMIKEHILYIHFSAKLQDCKEFKSDSILQSAVDALIWVCENKEKE